eukprot:239552-Chlamydomonas_euryale.AAC.1
MTDVERTPSSCHVTPSHTVGPTPSHPLTLCVPHPTLPVSPRARAQLAMAGGGGGARGMTDDELRSANPIMMLLRSLMPWVDAGQQPDYGGDRPAGGPGGGAA